MNRSTTRTAKSYPTVVSRRSPVGQGRVINFVLLTRRHVRPNRWRLFRGDRRQNHRKEYREDETWHRDSWAPSSAPLLALKKVDEQNSAKGYVRTDVIVILKA